MIPIFPIVIPNPWPAILVAQANRRREEENRRFYESLYSSSNKRKRNYSDLYDDPYDIS